MAKKKTRWKDLPPYERIAKRCRQKGVSGEVIDRIERYGKEKQNNK